MCDRCRQAARELYALIGVRPERDPKQDTGEGQRHRPAVAATLVVERIGEPKAFTGPMWMPSAAEVAASSKGSTLASLSRSARRREQRKRAKEAENRQ